MNRLRSSDTPAIAASMACNSPRSLASDFSVVVVIYNSADRLAECLASITASAQVIVVDNASTDDGPEIAANALGPEQVIQLGENVGFAAGCNAGAARATRELLLFLNPDAVLESGALETLAVEAGPRIIVGPEVQDLNGCTRHVCRRRSSPLRDLAELVPLVGRIVPQSVRRDRGADDPIYEEGGDVDYVQGAALAISREFFFELGGFDEAFFLYAEEEELCARAWAAGGRCRYEPRAAVRHAWGTSTELVPAFATRQHYRSRMLLYRRRYGAAGGMIIAASLSIAICMRVLVATFQHAGKYRAGWALPAIGGVAAGFRADPAVRRPFA